MKTITRKLIALMLILVLSPASAVIGQVVNEYHYENDGNTYDRREEYNKAGQLRYLQDRLYLKPVTTKNVEGLEIVVKPAHIRERFINVNYEYEYSDVTNQLIQQLASPVVKEGKQVQPVVVSTRTPEWIGMHSKFIGSIRGFINGDHGFGGIINSSPQLSAIRASARDCTANHHHFNSALHPSIKAGLNKFNAQVDEIKTGGSNKLSIQEELNKMKAVVDTSAKLFSDLAETLEIADYIKKNYGVIPINCPVFRPSFNWNSVSTYATDMSQKIKAEMNPVLEKIEKAEKQISSTQKKLATIFAKYEERREELNQDLLDFQYCVNNNEALVRSKLLQEDLLKMRKMLNSMKAKAKRFGLTDLVVAFQKSMKDVKDYEGFVSTYMAEKAGPLVNLKVDEAMRTMLQLQGEPQGYDVDGLIDLDVLNHSAAVFKAAFMENADVSFDSFESFFDSNLGGGDENTHLNLNDMKPGQVMSGDGRKLYRYEFSDKGSDIHARIGILEGRASNGKAMVAKALKYDENESKYTVAYKGKGQMMMVEVNDHAVDHFDKIRTAVPLEERDYEAETVSAIEESQVFIGEKLSGVVTAERAAVVASTLADFTVFLGVPKAFVELTTGIDPITGFEVGRLEAAMALTFSIIPIPGAGKVGRLVGKGVSRVVGVGAKGTARVYKNGLGEVAEAVAFGKTRTVSRRIVVDPANKQKIWRAPPMIRGTAIEDHLAKTSYKEYFRVGALDRGKFPLIDFQKGKEAVSLKTVNTKGKTWVPRIEAHLKELKNRILIDDLVPERVVLDLRVQPGGARIAKQKLSREARRNNVRLKVKEFK